MGDLKICPTIATDLPELHVADGLYRTVNGGGCPRRGLQCMGNRPVASCGLDSSFRARFIERETINQEAME
jgi:hypothetical protein